MHVYVDESGDCGFRFAENSSSYFVVAALIVDDPLILRGLIDGYKAKYRISASRELKFRSTPPDMRHEFFATICTTEFLVAAVAVDKTRLIIQPDATAFYREYVSMVIASGSGEIMNARLVIDESVRDKRWQGKMKAYLRQQINTSQPGCITDIRFNDASQESLLQATDMLCGAIRVAVEGGDDRYLRSLDTRMLGLVSVPAR